MQHGTHAGSVGTSMLRHNHASLDLAAGGPEAGAAGEPDFLGPSVNLLERSARACGSAHAQENLQARAPPAEVRGRLYMVEPESCPGVRRAFSVEGARRVLQRRRARGPPPACSSLMGLLRPHWAVAPARRVPTAARGHHARPHALKWEREETTPTWVLFPLGLCSQLARNCGFILVRNSGSNK
jgi:hypothetical protein